MTVERRILYHFPLCPFSRKVRLLLFEKGLPYGLITEIPWERRPEFLKINPFATVPVMVEPDGHVLSDHVAICEYIQEIKTLPSLLGETPRGRAEIRRITNIFDSAFFADVLKPLFDERVVKALYTKAEPDSVRIRIARDNLRSYLGYLEWLVVRRSYLGGRNLSVADLGVAAHLSVLDYLNEVPWDSFVETKMWYAKIKSRPSFNSLLNDHLSGIMPADHYSNLDF